MGRIVQYEIADEIYQAIEAVAERAGISTEAALLQYLARHTPGRRVRLSDEELRSAQERFRLYIGSGSLGHPTGIDNENIDADLAREYDGSHESLP